MNPLPPPPMQLTMTITTTAEDQNDHSNLGKKIRFITRKPRLSSPTKLTVDSLIYKIPELSGVFSINQGWDRGVNVPEHWAARYENGCRPLGYRLRRTRGR